MSGQDAHGTDEPRAAPSTFHPDQVLTFSYRHMVFRHQARLQSDRLTVTQGLFKLETKLPEIVYLFVQPTDAFQTLVLSIRTASGKARVVRLRANAGDPAFVAMTEAIVALRPDIDLRALDEQTALARMGVRPHGPVGMMLVLFLLPAIVSVALLPKLLHGLDFGEERLSVNSLAKGKRPSSRNVVITGARARLQESIEVTTSRTGGSDTSGATRYLVPIVPPDWQKAQPVHVVLETDEMDSADEARLERASKFQGIMRDILWEGLDGGDRDYFVSEVGLNLADDVKLVEHRANPRYDLMVFGTATGVSFAVTFAILLGIWLRNPRE